jgi:hypothetical protein
MRKDLQKRERKQQKAAEAERQKKQGSTQPQKIDLKERMTIL